MQPDSNHIGEKDEDEILENFIIQSRFVLENLDVEKLQEVTKDIWNLKIKVREDIRRKTRNYELEKKDLPDFYLMTTAAVLARPFFIKGEDVSIAKLLNILTKKGFFKNQSFNNELNEIEKHLKTFNIYANSSRPIGKHTFSVAVDSNEIATGFIYGFLLHTDIKRKTYALPAGLEFASLTAYQYIVEQLKTIKLCFETLMRMKNECGLLSNSECWDKHIKIGASWIPEGTIQSIKMLPLDAKIPTDPNEPLDPRAKDLTIENILNDEKFED